ncbi:MAG: amidohydrolase [Clostridiales bacterium GWB2_37_7]|nr:MAG: amidohydrolase [Clostridiales bacterium GWB2_37_7]
MKAIINIKIYDYKSYIDNGYIKFNSEITEIGDMESFSGAEEVVDGRGCILMPGMTNCHTHIYSAFARGMNIPFNPKNFTDILEQLWWKLDKQLDQTAAYYSAMSYGIDCIKSGVTSIIDHHASGLCIEGVLDTLNDAVSKSLGMRSIYCFETSDRFPLEECIRENIRFRGNGSEHTGSMFGMHASMSLSSDSLKRISESIGDMPVHIHVAESIDDVRDCYQSYNKSIVERLDSYGLLNKNSILAHCVHINEEEAALIAERCCYVAINPTSNMNNAVGLPNYDLLRGYGLRCLLGNDGLGSNITRDYLNLMFAMKNRLGSPNKFSMEDLVQVIRNGYEFISASLNIKLGKIEAGYKADFIVVPYDSPTPINEENILGHIVFGVFDSFKPKHVWISGKQMVKDYKLVFEVESEMEAARHEASKVWRRLN